MSEIYEAWAVYNGYRLINPVGSAYVWIDRFSNWYSQTYIMEQCKQQMINL